MCGDQMISVVIGHWPKSQEHDDALKRCLDSLTGPYEFIVVVNDGIGFAKTYNRGLALAHGDFICVVNNDTELTAGHLENLCLDGCVTVPKMESGQVDNMPRAFYCMDRKVYEQVGGYDERFELGYFEDDDLIKRWQDAGIPIIVKESVKVKHVGGLTMKTLNTEAIYESNKNLFHAKHKDL